MRKKLAGVIGIVALLVSILLFPSLAFAGEFEILNVTSASTTPAKIYPGDVVTLTFNVSNISSRGQVAVGIVARTELNENDFSPLKVTEKFDSIGAKSSKTVSFRFGVKGSVLPGTYTVPVILEYNSGATTIIQKDDVSFSVLSCSQLKVEDIKLSDSTPHIGDSLEVAATITNSCLNAARNVDVELRPITNSTIAPFVVTGGTVKKLGDILPNESRQATFSVLIGDKVDAKAYVFSIDGNCDGCSSTFSNKFSFEVMGKPQLVFSNIDYSVEGATGKEKQIMQGSTFTLSVQLDNIGEEKAKAVEVNIDFGKDIVGTLKSFLGNINPDDSGAAVFNLRAAYDTAPGSHPGTITVRYVDELGKKQEFTQSYSLYVNPQSPTNPVVYIVILVLVVVVLALVYFIVKFVFRQLAIRKAQSR